MRIVSAAEMRQIDSATSQRFGVPSTTLMENAGTAVAEFVLEHWPETRKIAVVCGKGNNGGDGLVIARKLSQAGKQVVVLLLAKPAELRGDAAEMLEKCPVEPVVVTTESELAEAVDDRFFDGDLIVDALLGTGFHPPMSELYAGAIEAMNLAKAPVVAVDIPSGADADAKQPSETVRARADAIVTFTAPRPAHVFARLTDGPTIVAPIGSPPEVIESESKSKMNLITAADFAALLAPRSPDSHKGDYGHVLVIGGSTGKAGAAAMAGMAALRAGAGLVTVATPRSVQKTVASFAAELMTEPLDETDSGGISLKALECGRMEKLCEDKDVLAIGPGLGREPETVEFVRALVAKPHAYRSVIDADGLNAFEGIGNQLDGRGRTLILTPHPGEFSRLTGMSVADLEKDSANIAQRFAADHHCILVLKGHRTLVASPDGELWINATGNAGMAKGGSGDVLTGLIAALLGPQADMRYAYYAEKSPDEELKELYLASKDVIEEWRERMRRHDFTPLSEEQQAKAKPFWDKMQERLATAMLRESVKRVCAAVYLHGFAGDIAREEMGERAMVASDIIDSIGEAFRRAAEQVGDKTVTINP